MGQEASRWPRGVPAGPLSRCQSSGLFGSSLQESAGGKVAGERETDPAGLSLCLCPIQRVWKSFGAGNDGEERSGEAKTPGLTSFPTGWKERELWTPSHSSALLTP